jgi:hypothetical protein
MKSESTRFTKKSYKAAPDLSPVRAMADSPLTGIAGEGKLKIVSPTNFTAYRHLRAKLLGGSSADLSAPALLSAEGKHLSQTLFFVVSGVSADDEIKLTGIHKGKTETFYHSDKSPVILDRFGGDVIIPAVVHFPSEGVWKINAFANGDPIGHVDMSVYRSQIKNVYAGSIIDQGVLHMGLSTLTANGFRKHGAPTLPVEPEVTFQVQILSDSGMKTKHPLPIVISGVQAESEESFILKFSKSEVTVKDDKYVINDMLPMQTSGKWELKIYEGPYEIGKTILTVR